MSPAPAHQTDPQADLAELIARLVAELEPLHLQLNIAVWNANITGDPVHEQESARLEAAIREVYSRREPFAFLKALKSAGGVSDARLARQGDLLFNSFQANQIPPATIQRLVALEKKLESRFNTFRALLDNERVADNAIRQLLRESEDQALRRRAWEASKQIGAEIEGDLLELVRLRNQTARELGFDDHYAMSLWLKDELDEPRLFAWLEQVERGTRPLYETYKHGLDQRLCARFGIKPGELRPWHYSDPFFQEAPVQGANLDPCFAGKALEDLTRRFFEAVGFDIRDLLARADLYEKPGKCQHAFCMSVNRGEDVRVLCNVRSDE